MQASSHPEVVQITVSDTGEGIAPEQLPHIFDRFWSRSEGGGSGLGLAIARSLVHAHGGRIEADNAPGEGAVFTVSLLAEPDYRNDKAATERGHESREANAT